MPLLSSCPVLGPNALELLPKGSAVTCARCLCRYLEQEQDSRKYPGGPGPRVLEVLSEACRGAMRYAQKYNAYMEAVAGQAALVCAWQAFVEIVFTRRCWDPQ
jgi:hypothetical protein